MLLTINKQSPPIDGWMVDQPLKKNEGDTWIQGVSLSYYLDP